MRRTGLFLLVALATATTAWGFMYTTGDYLGPGIDYRPVKVFFAEASVSSEVPYQAAYTVWDRGFWVSDGDTSYTATYLPDETGEPQLYFGLTLSEILERIAADVGADAIINLRLAGSWYLTASIEISGTAVKILDTGVSTQPPR